MIFNPGLNMWIIAISLQNGKAVFHLLHNNTANIVLIYQRNATLNTDVI